jgi:hypothetical protein
VICVRVGVAAVSHGFNDSRTRRELRFPGPISGNSNTSRIGIDFITQ